MPASGPVPRELHEAKGAAGQILDLDVLLVLGQRVAPYARGPHFRREKERETCASEGCVEGGLTERSQAAHAKRAFEDEESFVLADQM